MGGFGHHVGSEVMFCARWITQSLKINRSYEENALVDFGFCCIRKQFFLGSISFLLLFIMIFACAYGE